MKMKGKILEVIYEDEDLIFKLRKRKRLDIIISEDVKSMILKTINRKTLNKKYKKIIFDFQAVHFIDSTAIAMLMVLYRKLRRSGYGFYITNISNEMMELIQLVPILESLIIDLPVNSKPTLAA